MLSHNAEVNVIFIDYRFLFLILVLHGELWSLNKEGSKVCVKELNSNKKSIVATDKINHGTRCIS